MVVFSPLLMLPDKSFVYQSLVLSVLEKWYPLIVYNSHMFVMDQRLFLIIAIHSYQEKLFAGFVLKISL